MRPYEHAFVVTFMSYLRHVLSPSWIIGSLRHA